MEEYFVSSANLTYLLNRLNDTDLIVNHYHRYHNCVRSDSSLQLLQVDQAVCLNRQICHIKTLLLKVTAAI